MAYPRWSRALLWLALASARVPADASAEPQYDRRLQAANNATSAAVSCPSTDSLLARAPGPALTPLCPASCEVGGVCVFYPQGFQGDCVTTPERTCVNGDACAFGCLSGTGADTPGWFLTFYDTPSVVEDAVRSNIENSLELAQYRSVAINVSQVSQWIGSFKFPTTDSVLFIAGNEPANSMVLDEVAMHHDDLSLPPGDIASFTFPLSFFDDVRGYGWLRLENLQFPAVANVSRTFAFPGLTKLFLRNTMLTSFPLANASFPVLDTLDLSVNTIPEIEPSTIPDSVRYLNLSWNTISQVAKDALPRNLTTLGIRLNPIKDIANGTLPLGIQQLWLMQNQLTAIPGDVAGMAGLTQLYLDDNDLREIPNAAIPPSRLETLSIENCSLTAVPKVIQSMTRLKELWLGRNDLSREPDFSWLPKSLEMLSLRDCQLQKLPAEFKNLRSLRVLDLENNPRAMTDLSIVSKQLQQLRLANNALDAIPVDVKRLTVEALFLENNPLGQISPGSLPSTLVALWLSNTTFRVLPNGTLPAKLTEIMMSNCALEETPGDLWSLRQLAALDFSSCRLEAFDMGDKPVQSVELMSLSNNRIASFTGSYPTAVRLELRNNALTTLSDVKAPKLRRLDLSGNKISLFPDSIFQMPELLVLNLTGNPIRNFMPTADQLTFLGRIQTLVLDEAMFASDCEPSTRVIISGYPTCPQEQAIKATPASKSWKWLVPLNAALVLVLALLVYTFWRRRKLQKQRLQDLAMEQASLAKQQQDQTTISIWADAALLRDRFDEDLIVRKRLLGTGMFGEVWLAVYKNDKVALKQLKPGSSGAAASKAVSDFVHEIKLLQSLTHPSVVQFLGVVWTKESDIAMVTEYMAGGDLRSYLDHHPKIYAGWTTQMVRIALQITEAIVYLHSLDPIVIHRDLKSRNVLLDTAMRTAKLSDFGVSRYKLDDDTMTAGVGTVRWVAPEVLAGQRYDESVDIYSLGVIFSEIDTHRLPFEGLADESGGELLSDSAIAGMVVTGALRVSVGKSCPSEIRSLVERCTAFEAAARPNAYDVAYELRAMLEGSSASTETSSRSSGRSGIFLSVGSPPGTAATRAIV